MIYQIFIEAIANCRKRRAMVMCDGRERLTYQGLHRHVVHIANQLIKQGVDRGDRVISLFRDEDYHLSVYLALNLLKAVYIPFEETSSVKKVQFAIAALGIDKIITDDLSLMKAFSLQEEAHLKILNIRNFPRIPKKKIQISPNKIIDSMEEELEEYIIFSSGTTGDPKAIAIPPQGLEYWVDILKQMSIKNILITRGPAFDARIFEYLVGFANKATLHFLNSNCRRDIEKIVKYCEKNQAKPIDCILLIASQLKDERAEPYIKRLAAAKVSHLLVTGDVLTPTLKELCEKYYISLWNCYGPTESTFGLSICRVNNLPMLLNEHGTPIAPIGQPKAPVRAVIHNDTLHIISPYLGRYITPGYLGSEFTEIGGERAFDTGDLMKLNESYYEFGGRKEFCKVDGVKIKPTELENYILNFRDASRDVIQAAVVQKEYLGAMRPICYIVPTTVIDKEAFKRYMAERFSKEEQPIFFEIDTLPIQESSEKKSIDRKKLVSLPIDLHKLFFRKNDSIEIKNDEVISLECQVIKAIWCSILGLEDVSLDVGFTDIGGTSIQSQQMVSSIQEKIDSSYNYSKFLSTETTTIRSIAHVIKNDSLLMQTLAPVKLLRYHGKDSLNIFFIADILGDAYFTYISLAKLFVTYWNCNIYGISHPGVIDTKKLTNSKEEIVGLFLEAIKKIQQHGEINLLGYSLGAWWVYEIAKELYLHNHGLSVGAIYLMDGYPALYYHILPNDAYLNLLQILINKIVAVLNNNYYQEKIDSPQIDVTWSEYDKLILVKKVCSHLSELATKDISKNLIEIAQHNLLLLQSTKDTDDVMLPYSVFLYLSDQRSKYHSIKDLLGVDYFSNNSQYCFWDNLFYRIYSNLCKSGDHEDVVLACSPYSFFKNIQEVLQSPKDRHKKLAASKNYENFPSPFFCLNELGELSGDQYQLSVYFMRVDIMRKLAIKLYELGLKPYISYHGRNLPKLPEESYISICEYQALGSLFCNIPGTSLVDIKKLQDDQSIWHAIPKVKFAPIVDFCQMYIDMKSPTATIDICFDIEGVLGWILTLSFKVYADPALVIQMIKDKFDQTPDSVSKNCENIIYRFRNISKFPLALRYSEPDRLYQKYRDFNDSTSGSESSESEKEFEDKNTVIEDEFLYTPIKLAKAKKLPRTKKLKPGCSIRSSGGLGELQFQTIYIAFEHHKDIFMRLVALLAPFSVRRFSPSREVSIDFSQRLFDVSKQDGEVSDVHSISAGVL